MNSAWNTLQILEKEDLSKPSKSKDTEAQIEFGFVDSITGKNYELLMEGPIYKTGEGREAAIKCN